MSIAQELRLQRAEQALEQCDVRLVELMKQLEAMRDELAAKETKTLHLKDKPRV